jgi:hypothetical protein
MHDRIDKQARYRNDFINYYGPKDACLKETFKTDIEQEHALF